MAEIIWAVLEFALELVACGCELADGEARERDAAAAMFLLFVLVFGAACVGVALALHWAWNGIIGLL